MQYHVRTTDELGTLLRELRKQQAMTQAELASLSGVGRQRISDIESGKGGLRVASFLALLDALNSDLVLTDRQPSDSAIDLDELLGLADQEGGPRP